MDIKKLSPAKIQSLALEMFDYHDNVDVFYATEDGQFFTGPAEANFHARQNGLKVQKFNRHETEGEETPEDEVPEGTPDKKWKVDDIRKWMEANEIPFEDGDTKAKLLAKVEKVDNPETRKEQ